MHHDKIAVVDFGGQYAHLIAAKVRRQGVLAEILQPEDPPEAYNDFKGIIISGSPSLASQNQDSQYDKAIYDLSIPILGLCFGHQEVARHYGGDIIYGGREWGHANLRLDGEHPIFRGLGPVEPVWMSHFDSVAKVGPGFEELGYTEGTGENPQHRYAAIGNDELKRYGFQFHPEVDDTAHGDVMLRNFVLEICGCKPTWDMETFLAEEIEAVRKQVGDGSVFLLVSGGVDSTVAAAVLGEALGPDRLMLLHVDNGLMRKNESKQVLELFGEIGLRSQLHFVDASDRFLRELEGVTEPERKRVIIGETFVRVFEEKARELGIEKHLLGQGTIYPDTVETGGTRRADVIKTHHNRVGLIEEMVAKGLVVEPLKELYKVEVRELGEKLGIDARALWRHPFPGPGLGVRCLCSDGTPYTANFGEIRSALPPIAARFGLTALALPIRSVGVKADLRVYEHPVLLSGEVKPSSTPSRDAHPHEVPGPQSGAAHTEWTRRIQAVSAITSEVPHVNRCIWNLGPGNPERATVLEAYMTRERLDTLREADTIVMEALHRHGLYDEIWQCPTVLVPLQLEGTEGELIVLRPVKSQRAMTAAPVELPAALVDEIREPILSLPGVGSLTLDLTSKPPGTIEWE